MVCLLEARVRRSTENAPGIDGFNAPQPGQALVQQVINKKARRLAVPEGQSSLRAPCGWLWPKGLAPSRARAVGELRLVPGPSLQLTPACFPETRYAFAKPNTLWQRQLKISSAFVSLELGPAEGTGRQPEPGTFLFCFVFFRLLRRPLCKGLPLAAPCSRRDPGAPAMEHAQRGAPTLPDRRGGSCCGGGVRVPRSSQGAADTASAVARGPGS